VVLIPRLAAISLIVIICHMLLSQKELQKAVPFKKHTYCIIAWDSVPDFLTWSRGSLQLLKLLLPCRPLRQTGQTPDRDVPKSQKLWMQKQAAQAAACLINQK
jgi:hypothetical protein